MNAQRNLQQKEQENQRKQDALYSSNAELNRCKDYS